MENNHQCGSCTDGMSLPEYHMVAGESKCFTIPIYDYYNRQIDATGMTARFAICGYVNPHMEPFITKQCNVTPWESGVAVLSTSLIPDDTLSLTGKFLYQITAKDASGDVGVMRGVLYIHPNGDKSAIKM